MNIGIIGSGNIGGTLAALLAGAGHQIAISNSRGPETLTSLVKKIGPGLKATITEEAANFGEVVILATPFKAYRDFAPELLAGKIVVDTMNYYPQRDGVVDLGSHSSTELVASYFNQSQVIKAFNTFYYMALVTGGDNNLPAGERVAILVAGDDTRAKAMVADLIREIGFTAVDTGSLREGSRLQEPGSKAYGKELKGREVREILGKI